MPSFADAVFAAHAIAKATMPRSKLSFFAIERRVSSRLKPLVFASANMHSMAQRVNQTGFTGEQKAWKVSHEQRKIREPFFDRSKGARGAFGA